MSSEETRLWNIQSNSYFHVPVQKVPMQKVPVPKVPAQNSNTIFLIWQTSSDCDPLSIGSWVTQLWCLATQNPSLQTGEVFLFFFFLYWTIFCYCIGQFFFFFYIGQFFFILLDNFFYFIGQGLPGNISTAITWKDTGATYIFKVISENRDYGNVDDSEEDDGNYHWIFLQGNQYWKFTNKVRQVRGENHICAEQKLNASCKTKPD